MSRFVDRFSAGEISGDFSKLEGILADLLADHHVDIGILDGEVHPDGDGQTIATIGAHNEFGVFSKNLPARSFLRMPITLQIEDIKDSVRLNAKANILDQNVKGIFEDMGAAAVEVVREAFDTQGWGQWPDNAPYTIAKKGRNEPLVDTGVLRDKIDWRAE